MAGATSAQSASLAASLAAYRAVAQRDLLLAVRRQSEIVNPFVFFVIVSVFIAYVGSRTLPPGTPYLDVFQVVGTVAILAYAASSIPHTIWFGRPWSNTLKDIVDGVVYGLLTAGVFGWLWP